MTFGRIGRLVILAFVIVFSTETLHADLIGITWDFENSGVYRINEVTGEAALIGYSGLSRTNSLAQDSSGRLYTVGSLETGPGPSNVLAMIDPVTGAATVIGPLTGVENVNVLSMAFSPDGILFAALEKSNGTGDKIVAINPSTAEVVVIADVGPVDEYGIPLVGSLMGLDFGPDGLLYGWGTNEDLVGLVVVDPFTGLVLDVDPNVGAIYGQAVQSLVFLEDGTLYGQYDSSYCNFFGCTLQGTLVNIDPASGATTFVGNNIAGDIRGLAVYKIPQVEVIPVAIDIKPGDDFNAVNPGSKGLIPVAILSSDAFDATLVEPSTILLEGANVAVRGKGNLLAHEEDVNQDGLIDLVCQVETESLSLEPDVGEVCLTGETILGDKVEGCDLILIVPDP